jgi:UMF1 family MFS transporter
MGYDFKNTALYSYCLSLAFLINVLLVPLLSGISDASGAKKPFMRFFVILGSLGCSSLFFFNGDNYLFGLGCFMVATLGWAGSLVFYNAFLPEIATPDRFDRLSARGFTMGYIGSVLMLIFNLLLLIKHDWFGLPSPKESVLPFQIGFLTVGIWWLAWSFWPLIKLPGKLAAKSKSSIWSGYHEIRKVFAEVRTMKSVKIFLGAFFVYTMGVQTVIYVAALFGKDVLLLKSEEMLTTILLIQLIGIAGAYFFAFLADRIGNKAAIFVSLIIWTIACSLAFKLEPRHPEQFFALACLIGTVMGGIQSLSRATYAKLIPGDRDNTSYFSFFEVTEKLGIVLGTFAWAAIDNVTGDMRNSILSLMVFFFIGMGILYFLPTDKLQPSKKK